MGTNFYIGGIHIGKRSAAGLYCWDCNETLCPRGKEGVHMGPREDIWPDACPSCGAKPGVESLDSSTVGRELGFNRSMPARKEGVMTASSFSWAMPPASFIIDRRRITDEYRRKYSRQAFGAVLSECPIQFYDSIGGDFS